jgi:hypothetical protein
VSQKWHFIGMEVLIELMLFPVIVFVCLCDQASKDILAYTAQKKCHSGKKQYIYVAA